MMTPASKTVAITTSWDDGHPLDLRLAELLAMYGVKGTFYIPIADPLVPRMSRDEIRELRRIGMEIGSHTQTHPRIHRLNPATALVELRDSKAYLEDLLGEEVPAFCYPEGKFSRRNLGLIDQAGYRLARTTIGFRTDLGFDPRLMPVGLQFWKHSRRTLLQHALVQRNFRGAANWMRLWNGEHDPGRLAQSMLRYIRQSGGVLHLWGHSWELEQGDLWKELEDTLKRISEFGPLAALTNSQLADLVIQAKSPQQSVYA
ncbi:MAG: polysaccharide deacetylase family protein [Acidobacteriota bacterium]|nr:polysaccharide deacetylase family protein [Acidobacteriota bacterium]